MQSAKQELMKTRISLAKKIPWYWLRYIVCTKDEHDPTVLAKPFPVKAMYRIITRCWLECNILFIEKSRQIMMTWIMAALDLWDAMTLYNRLVFFQSQKQEDADKVLERAKHIYRQAAKIDIPWIPKAKKTGEKLGTSDILEFPDMGSVIQSIPQGPDVVRSNTCSRILADEMNHQAQFDEGYAAANPTIQGGGKYGAQGTANGKTFGYHMLHGIDEDTLKSIGEHEVDSKREEKLFVAPSNLSKEEQRLWIDKKIVDMDEDEFNAIPLEKLVACMPGMRYWITANGIHCLRVHYSADPDKSPDTSWGRAWIAEARKTMTKRMWDREMEIKYDTFEGRPVLPQFTTALYVRKLDFDSDIPLLLSADFGKSCGCLFSQKSDIPNHDVKRLKFLDEIYLEQGNTDELAQMIREKLEKRFPRAWENNSILMYCDPAGNQERETTSDKSMNSSIKILNAYGLYPFSKKFGIPESVLFVDELFSKILPDGLPAVLIDPICEYLISVCDGGWHFPKAKKGVTARPGFPEKDNHFEHGGDMLRYKICNIFDEFYLSDQLPPTQKNNFIYRKHTGEIIGHKKSTRIEPRRGQHRVRTRAQDRTTNIV